MKFNASSLFFQEVIYTFHLFSYDSGIITRHVEKVLLLLKPAHIHCTCLRCACVLVLGKPVSYSTHFTHAIVDLSGFLIPSHSQAGKILGWVSCTGRKREERTKLGTNNPGELYLALLSPITSLSPKRESSSTKHDCRRAETGLSNLGILSSCW